MSTPGGPPPTYGAASAGHRPRPSPWWFVVGAVLVVVAAAVLGATVARTVGSFTTVDATVSPGTAATVQVDGRRLLIWEHPGQPAACTVHDSRGAAVSTSRPGATYTKSINGDSWRGLAELEPAAGAVEVRCEASGGPAQIGPAPSFGGLTGVLLGIVAPILLGLTGLVVLVVTGILWIVRRRPVAPSAPGPQEA